MKNKTMYIPLGMMFLLYFVIAFTTGLNNPFAKVIQTQFTLSTFESQLGTFAFFISYLFMGYPASLLVRKWGYKTAALFALIGVFFGFCVVYMGGSFGALWLYFVGVFIIGCSIAVLQVVVNPLVKALGPEETASSRMNFGGSCSSTGATLAPLLVGIMIGNVVAGNLQISDLNPLLFTILGLLIVIFIVLYKVNIPKLNLTLSDEPTIKGSAFQFPHFRWGLLAIFLYVGVEVATSNLTNLYMMNELKMDAGIAGAIVGTYWLLMFVGRFSGGFIGRVVSSRTQLIVVSSLALLLYLGALLISPENKVIMPAINSNFELLLAQVPVNVLLLVLVGLCTSVMWSCIFIQSTEGLGKYTNQATGFMIMMIAGGGVIPSVQGQLQVMLGSFLPSYWVGFVCFAYILLFALFVKKAPKSPKGVV
ncbi:MAG: MFS transporter [Paludibacteraceae bacterium]|nr:MFS transporter [Paludibacteraceae bacterium]MBN2787240.1 MFS transporter [Paludibacteraceae bacterium]